MLVDHVLTVAVSIAAGVAALVSAFPTLPADRLALALGLGILGVLTALNLRGLATSARALLLRTGVFVPGTYGVIVVGLLRQHPVAGSGIHQAVVPAGAGAVGVLLVLRAFAAGCSALTGVEAIANDVPAFREPRARRAMRAEVPLGGLLGTMPLGLSVLTVRFHIAQAASQAASQTELSQLTRASFGTGPPYNVTDLWTTAILAIAANTSFGGLPMLACLLARDNPCRTSSPFGATDPSTATAWSPWPSWPGRSSSPSTPTRTPRSPSSPSGCSPVSPSPRPASSVTGSTSARDAGGHAWPRTGSGAP